MRGKISALAALMAAMAFGPQAHASAFNFGFHEGGFVIQGAFTYAPDVSPADPNGACGTTGNNPCRADPAGADMITGITGTFTDARNGIFNETITGLVPISPANERDPVFDPLVPTSLSFLDYAPGQSLTYNNLLFPTGSPVDCDFPFSGTFLDVFGVAFTVSGGETVDIWGDGDVLHPGNRTYGIGVTQGTSTLTYQFAGLVGGAAVPEPTTWAVMLLGLGALGFGLRRRRSSQAATA